MNDVNSPGVRSPAAISRLPYHRTPAIPMPPSSSITDGRIERALVTRMIVRYRRREARVNLCCSNDSP